VHRRERAREGGAWIRLDLLANWERWRAEVTRHHSAQFIAFLSLFSQGSRGRRIRCKIDSAGAD
jgi:hypothetical protein